VNEGAALQMDVARLPEMEAAVPTTLGEFGASRPRRGAFMATLQGASN
jgi:hypothetical protein